MSKCNQFPLSKCLSQADAFKMDCRVGAFFRLGEGGGGGGSDCQKLLEKTLKGTRILFSWFDSNSFSPVREITSVE